MPIRRKHDCSEIAAPPSRDILTMSPRGTSRQFWNNGDGTFTDGTAPIDANLGLSDMGLARRRH
jgi:hypothetical protein